MKSNTIIIRLLYYFRQLSSMLIVEYITDKIKDIYIYIYNIIKNSIFINYTRLKYNIMAVS